MHIFHNNSLFVSQCSYNLRSKPFHLVHIVQKLEFFLALHWPLFAPKKEEAKSRTPSLYLTLNFYFEA